MGQATRRRVSNAVFCLVLLGLTLGALGHVAVQAKKVEVAFLLGKHRAIHEELVAEQRHLMNDVARLKEPRRLVQVAQSKLGMTPQADIKVLRPASSPGVTVTSQRPGGGR